MKQKILSLLLSLTILVFTLTPYYTPNVRKNQSITHFISVTTNIKYKLQNHIPAPSSDDFEFET
ncbi:MAG: hypothetical protein IJR29_08235 [Butyrivibrio sp.]|nr:hypothetical protein [Butyrivibrio sp.]